MARRPAHVEHQVPLPSGAPSSAWEGRLEVIIAIALDFHQATHQLLQATVLGIRSPQGRSLELRSSHEVEAAEDHQERASRFTLAEVILATSLFLFGVAGISSRWRIKIGALSVATGIFLVAIVVLATA